MALLARLSEACMADLKLTGLLVSSLLWPILSLCKGTWSDDYRSKILAKAAGYSSESGILVCEPPVQTPVVLCNAAVRSLICPSSLELGAVEHAHIVMPAAWH